MPEIRRLKSIVTIEIEHTNAPLGEMERNRGEIARSLAPFDLVVIEPAEHKGEKPFGGWPYATARVIKITHQER